MAEFVDENDEAQADDDLGGADNAVEARRCNTSGRRRRSARQGRGCSAAASPSASTAAQRPPASRGRQPPAAGAGAIPLGDGTGWTARRSASVRRGASETAVPTAYLLSRPAVADGKFRQRRRRAVVMMIQGRAASARHVRESQFSGEEALHGRLVGGVEHRSASAAAPGHLIAQLQGRKRLMVGLLEVPRRQFAPVQPSRRPAHAFRIHQGVLNRQPHVRRRQLRQHRPVLETRRTNE